MARKDTKPLFVWRSAICESDLPAPARHVALTMALYMNERGGSCFPGGSRLTRDTGLSRRTVWTALGELEAQGWLIVVKRGSRTVKGGKLEANHYEARVPTSAGDALVPTSAGDALVQEMHSTSAGDAHQVFSNSPKTDAIESDFNEAWTLYPNKKERKAALRAYGARRKAGADAADLLAAVQHYAAVKAGTDPKYIKLGKTFFGRDTPWDDFVQPPTNSSSNGPPETVWREPDVPKWDPVLAS
jgi:hypothetical protein